MAPSDNEVSADLTVNKLHEVRGGNIRKRKKADKAVAVVMNKAKEGAYSEIPFDCPTSGCGAIVTRYRALFEHFSKFCRKEDAAVG